MINTNTSTFDLDPTTANINYCNTTQNPDGTTNMTIQECQYNFNMAICNYGAYQGWMDMFYCIDPNFWAFLGLALVLGWSIAGAAW